jgi:hypothetical protein
MARSSLGAGKGMARSRYFIPILGKKYSQPWKKLFPAWE